MSQQQYRPSQLFQPAKPNLQTDAHFAEINKPAIFDGPTREYIKNYSKYVVPDPTDLVAVERLRNKRNFKAYVDLLKNTTQLPPKNKMGFLEKLKYDITGKVNKKYISNPFNLSKSEALWDQNMKSKNVREALAPTIKPNVVRSTPIPKPPTRIQSIKHVGQKIGNFFTKPFNYLKTKFFGKGRKRIVKRLRKRKRHFK